MTKDIIKALGKRQVLRNHTPVVANITTMFNWECDLFSVSKDGMTYEFEVKISRSDFLRDKKKKKWEQMEWQDKTPNYISYACPTGLIKLEEISEGFGLYYYAENQITEIRSPSLRHSKKADINVIQMKVARMYSQREFLGRTLISHLNKEIRDRNNLRLAEQKKRTEDLMNKLNIK